MYDTDLEVYVFGTICLGYVHLRAGGSHPLPPARGASPSLGLFTICLESQLG